MYTYICMNIYIHIYIYIYIYTHTHTHIHVIAKERSNVACPRYIRLFPSILKALALVICMLDSMRTDTHTFAQTNAHSLSCPSLPLSLARGRVLCLCASLSLTHTHTHVCTSICSPSSNFDFRWRRHCGRQRSGQLLLRHSGTTGATAATTC